MITTRACVTRLVCNYHNLKVVLAKLTNTYLHARKLWYGKLPRGTKGSPPARNCLAPVGRISEKSFFGTYHQFGCVTYFDGSIPCQMSVFFTMNGWQKTDAKAGCRDLNRQLAEEAQTMETMPECSYA